MGLAQAQHRDLAVPQDVVKSERVFQGTSFISEASHVCDRELFVWAMPVDQAHFGVREPNCLGQDGFRVTWRVSHTCIPRDPPGMVPLAGPVTVAPASPDSAEAPGTVVNTPGSEMCCGVCQESRCRAPSK